jgi:phage terminase Nu1 subunit (DNA packaging protein)
MGKKRIPAVFPETVSAEELADTFGLSLRRVFQLVEEEVISKPAKKGEYPFRKSAREIIAYYQERSLGLPALKAQDSARQARADADTSEMKAGKEAGLLMLRSDVRKLWEDGFTRIREMVLKVPGLSAKKRKELTDLMAKIRLRDKEEE